MKPFFVGVSMRIGAVDKQLLAQYIRQDDDDILLLCRIIVELYQLLECENVEIRFHESEIAKSITASEFAAIYVYGSLSENDDA